MGGQVFDPRHPGQTLIVSHKTDNAFDLLDVPRISRVAMHERQPKPS